MAEMKWFPLFGPNMHGDRTFVEIELELDDPDLVDLPERARSAEATLLKGGVLESGESFPLRSAQTRSPPGARKRRS